MNRPYHPPKPGNYLAPTGKHAGYIIGEDDVAGFGKQDYYVAAIPSRLAREAITKHHYSHRVVNNSYVHLGVFYRDNFAGVLQFGYALNPHRANKVVADTQVGQYLELNRMWLSDVCPRNSESQAISFAIKYIKRVMPTVAWIQSFADERCGCLGVVYQAANFIYCGSHKTKFYFLDGEYYHELLVTAHKKSGQRGELIRNNMDRALKLTYNQYRYVYFIKRNWRSRLNLKTFPYPKPEPQAAA